VHVFAAQAFEKPIVAHRASAAVMGALARAMGRRRIAERLQDFNVGSGI
jgi:hypothetical protein